MSKQSHVSLITGASSGIGAALARREAAYYPKCKLALLARRQDKLEALAQELRKTGADVLVLPCDVSDQHACKSAIGKTLAHFGHIDRFIANAGFSEAVFGSDFDIKIFQSVMNCNLNGFLYFLPDLLQHFQARNKGHLVAVASLAAFVTVPGSAAYHCSKAGMLGVMHALRREFKHSPIATTLICPGFIKTDLTAKNRFPMPFLMELEPAAKKIHKAIVFKKHFLAFPKLLYWVSRLVGILPLGLQDSLLQRRYEKV
eukprot:COSAG01_NODE_1_length_100484_cov_170.446142_33_plen_258_part_00